MNALLGEEALETQETRKRRSRPAHDDAPRAARAPGGGLVLDTPGIRELQLWDAEEGLDEAFDDVEALAARVPLLRLRARVASRAAPCARRSRAGRSPAERFESYRKLQRELEALELRQNALLRSERRRHFRVQARARRKGK